MCLGAAELPCPTSLALAGYVSHRVGLRRVVTVG